nr:MAG TPA: hypothetical protein [Bacteriophage sp.]
MKSYTLSCQTKLFITFLQDLKTPYIFYALLRQRPAVSLKVGKFGR